MCSCIQTINETRLVKARKDYRDSCAEFIFEVLPDLRCKNYLPKKLTFKQWRLIAEGIRDNRIIKKGEVHEVTVNKMDGVIYTFRSKSGLTQICWAFELFAGC